MRTLFFGLSLKDGRANFYRGPLQEILSLDRKKLMSRIESRKRARLDVSEEERALEALDKYQEVSK